jgi:hypothetical protein
MLFGSYRVGEANDPKTYTAAVAAVLSHYPADVIRAVTDPHSGIAGKQKFMPNPAEVREACEELMETERRAQERERSIAETDRLLAESRAREARGGHRESYDDLKARLGECFGLKVAEGDQEGARRRRTEQLERANFVVLQRAGADMSAAIPVSPMLAEILHKQVP